MHATWIIRRRLGYHLHLYSRVYRLLSKLRLSNQWSFTGSCYAAQVQRAEIFGVGFLTVKSNTVIVSSQRVHPPSRTSANGASAPASVERTVETVRKEPVALKSFDEWRKTEKGAPFWRCVDASIQWMH